MLDEYDRKMILVRATGRVVKLETSGVPASRRFAFYDQVHTTGMDIKHDDAALAALTLGKDLTLRDLAQGAFRMRGIAKGQTIVCVITPEVEDLVSRELAAAGQPPPPTRELGLAPAVRARRVLVACVAWLVISAARAERVQFNQLCCQTVANVFRKVAFNELAASCAADGRGRRLRARAAVPFRRGHPCVAAADGDGPVAPGQVITSVLIDASRDAETPVEGALPARPVGRRYRVVDAACPPVRAEPALDSARWGGASVTIAWEPV